MDALNWVHFTEVEKFKYEDYTVSKDSMRALIHSILPERTWERLEFDDCWPMPRLHDRSSVVSDEEILDVLNGDMDFVDLVRVHLIEKANLDNVGTMKELYRQMGYEF